MFSTPLQQIAWQLSLVILDILYCYLIPCSYLTQKLSQVSCSTSAHKTLDLQVNVKDSVDWPEQGYQEFCQAHSEGSQAVYDELLSMCGIPRLLKELQKRQLEHMLSQRHQPLANLTALGRKLDVTVCVVQNMHPLNPLNRPVASKCGLPFTSLMTGMDAMS